MSTGDRETARISASMGEAAVALSAGDYEAAFLPELGMVGVSLTYRGDELLSLRDGLDMYRKGATVGLPLLAPWANRVAKRQFRVAGVGVDLRGLKLRTENGLPIHGTMVAARGWEVVRLEPARLHTRFDYGAREDLLKAFPFPHRLDLRATLTADGLRVELTVTPTGRRRVPISFGWHPYFRVPGDRRRWYVELPPRRHLALTSRGIPTGASRPEPAERRHLGTRLVDEAYALGRDRLFALEGGGRRVEVRFGARYPFAQVYALPGKPFVAIEPMTAATNALVTGDCPVVEPGRRFTAAFSISAT
jgi:galactose mutarotase-like enzyme